MSKARELMTTQHSDIRHLMKMLGFEVNNHGVCFGLSNMAAQAMFLGKFGEFNNRVKEIENWHWIITNASPEIFHDIEMKDLIKVLTKISSDMYLFNGASQKFLDNKIIKIIESSEKRKQTPKDQFGIDMLAFMNGIALYQDPALHTFMFEKGKAPTGHNAELTAPLVLPDAIESMKIANSFTGVYNNDDLKKYLTSMQNAVQTANMSKPIIIVLSSGSHAVTLSYSNTDNKWRYFDANKPAIISSDPADLVKGIFETHTRNGEQPESIIMSSRIIEYKNAVKSEEDKDLSNKHQEELQGFISEWKQSQTFKEIHQVTQDKSEFIAYNGYNWLNSSIKYHDHESANQLIANGISINQADEKGRFPLLFAVKNNNADMINWLIEKGAEINQTDKKGQTSLMIAVKNGMIEIATLLIEKGALDEASTQDVIHLLTIAAKNGRIEMIDLLLNTLGDKSKLRIATSLLPAAVEAGNAEMVKILLDNKAKANQAYENGITLLISAIKNDDVKIVKLLLAGNADINQGDPKGRTPLEYAKHYKNIEIGKLLLFKHLENIRNTSNALSSQENKEATKLLGALHVKIEQVEKLTSSIENKNDLIQAISYFKEIQNALEAVKNSRSELNNENHSHKKSTEQAGRFNKLIDDTISQCEKHEDKNIVKALGKLMEIKTKLNSGEVYTKTQMNEVLNEIIRPVRVKAAEIEAAKMEMTAASKIAYK